MKKIVKNSLSKYYCSKCDYGCSKKSHWTQHISTRKHKWKQMETLETKNSPSYIACGCGKKYRSRSGLYKHQQKCSFNDKEDNEKVADDNEKVADPSINSSTIMALLKKLGEKDKQIAELQKTVQPTFTNTNNITINLFLNEHCKDAMNLTDFVNKLQVSLCDLDYTNKQGYIEGISNLLIKNLDELDAKERPIHCSDKKRLQFYVKDEDRWEKDTTNRKIDTSINKVAYKHLKTIKEWEEQNPGYENTAQGMEKYFKKTQNIHPATDQGQKNDENLKILKKVAPVVHIKDAMENIKK